VRFYVFNTAVRESALVSQQIGIVALFVVVAMFTIDATLPVEWLLILDLLLSLVFISYTIEEATTTSPVQTARPEAHSVLSQLIYSNVRMFLLLFGALWGLSPVLKTLTTPISNDTIVALSVMFLLLHLLLHDYNDKNYLKNNHLTSENTSSSTFFRITPSPASLNAAIFASVLLSSRLESSLQAFALLFFSVELFAFSPYVRYKIKNSHTESAFTSMTVFITLLTTVILFTSFSRLFAVLYLSLIAFISFICPFWLIWIQKYKKYPSEVKITSLSLTFYSGAHTLSFFSLPKSEINGPWDEAVPTPLKK